MFATNDIFTIEEGSGDVRMERILWIDEGGIVCFTIDLQDEKALPVKRKMSDLQEMSRDGLVMLSDKDPFAFVYQSEGSLPDKYKEMRDDRWKCISSIATREPDIYESHKRGALVKRATGNAGKNKRLIYKYLKQYWQRGKVVNALLPDYKGSGSTKDKGYTRKTGRPRTHGSILGEGIIITEDIKRVFEISVKRYYHTTKRNPLAFTYNEMLRKFFVADYRYEGGVKKPILLGEDQLPTLRQFKYWYEKTYRIEEKLRKRKGNRKYELQDRAVLGSSVGDLYGPGTKYQIDATVADVYIVSSMNRNWIIGRPVIYVVIDVFSRMVVGVYVGLEGPSWYGAMMAISNAASDKVSFCKRYGISIEKDEWDCHHLPQALLADRGELEGYNVDRLIQAFNVKVENTPPYRGDWKGIVEQHFRIIHAKVKPFLPGFVDTDVKVRGDRDYRLDATLTLEEFTSVIIRCILHHNNNHWLANYNADEMLIQDDVSLIPRELWNWGIKHRTGKLRSYPEDIVKLHLLPSAHARVTYRGIEFKKMRYSSERSLKENWFGDARERSWRIPVCYDPRNMEQIYLPSEDGRHYEIATLLDHQQKYSGKPIEEVEYFFADQALKQKTFAHEETQQKSNLSSDIEHIVKKAKKSLGAEQVEASKNSKVKGIRKNRLQEKEALRKEEAFYLGTEDQSTGVEKAEEEMETKSSSGPSKTQLLRQKQKEMMENAKGKRS